MAWSGADVWSPRRDALSADTRASAEVCVDDAEISSGVAGGVEGSRTFSSVVKTGLAPSAARDGVHGSDIRYELRWPFSVVVDCDVGGCPYQYCDVLQSLRLHGLAAGVKNIGFHGANSSFIVGLRDEETKRKLLAVPNLEVKGRTAVCVPLQKPATVIRLKWIPPEVPDDLVTKYFARYGEVMSITRLFCPEKIFAHVEIMERRMLLELKPEVTVFDLPDFLFVGGHRVAVTVRGRPPICLHCQCRGHIRLFCPRRRRPGLGPAAVSGEDSVEEPVDLAPRRSHDASPPVGVGVASVFVGSPTVAVSGRPPVEPPPVAGDDSAMSVAPPAASAAVGGSVPDWSVEQLEEEPVFPLAAPGDVEPPVPALVTDPGDATEVLSDPAGCATDLEMGVRPLRNRALLSRGVGEAKRPAKKWDSGRVRKALALEPEAVPEVTMLSNRYSALCGEEG